MTLTQTERDAVAETGALPALTVQRLGAALDELGIKYGTLESGALQIAFGTGVFVASCIGEQQQILTIRGRWRGEPTIGEYEKVAELCNRWNNSNPWPRTFAEKTGAVVSLYADHCADYEHGVSLAQVKQDFISVFSFTNRFFEQIGEQLPAAAAGFQALLAQQAADPANN